MGSLLVHDCRAKRPSLKTVRNNHLQYYLQILSRSIILRVFLDAVKMNNQGIVIMRNVVRTTKLAEVRSTGFTLTRNR
jgi:hypothetical protein